MILTDEEKMLLTPTYHVFEMYKVHQDATMLPLDLDSDLTYKHGDNSLPAISASASRDASGTIHVSLVNIDPEQAGEVNIELRGNTVSEVSGRILTAGELSSHNSFEKPEVVSPEVFKGAKISKQMLSMTLPAKSIVVLEVK